jgi:AraC-like DNA-binding protein
MPTAWYEPMPVGEGLGTVLACSWTARPTGRHLLVPDGCMELLWVHRHADCGKTEHQLLLCGPEQTAWSFELPTGSVAAGVRFRPGLASRVLNVDASRIGDRRVDPAPIIGADRAAGLLALLAAVRSAGTGQPDVGAAHAAVLERFVAGLASTIKPSDDDRLIEIVVDAAAGPAHVPQHELAYRVGVTPRQLHRRMLRCFGYGTSTLARLLRFQRFLAYTEPELAGGRRTLAQLASIAGYADQAHLARDCRAITGTTVRAFLADYFPTFPDMSDPFKTAEPLAISLRT